MQQIMIYSELMISPLIAPIVEYCHKFRIDLKCQLLAIYVKIFILFLLDDSKCN